MQRIVIIGLFFLSNFSGYAQKRGYVWCFSDSSGINFNNITNPQSIHSAVRSRGSCASICDTNGGLLFYSAYNTEGMFGGPPDYNGEVYNKDHSRMQNGDLIITELWYQEQVIIPNPGDSSIFYLFSVNETGGLGLYYSTVNMSIDSGRGDVVQKNIQLQSYKADDCVAAIKHGNGRDWWILSRRWDSSNDEFYQYLVTPAGILGPFIQHVGTPTNNGLYRMTFSANGSKMACIDYRGLVELFLFDRCSGIITYDKTIVQEVTGTNYPSLWSCAYSPNERYLYLSTSGDTTYLVQLDL
jgi:hypothetical protein